MRDLKFRQWDSERKVWIYTRIFGVLSTGLKDKKGKEIYEEDIVFQYTGNDLSTKRGKGKYRLGILDVVKESRTGGCWEPVSDGLTSGKTRLAWEVVGNIKQNPEILEKEVPNELPPMQQTNDS